MNGRTFEQTMMSPISMRTKLASGALLLTAGLALMPSQAHAQTPNNVLLFPAVVNGDRNDSTKLVEDDVTEALRNQLSKLGIAAVVYNNESQASSARSTRAIKSFLIKTQTLALAMTIVKRSVLRKWLVLRST
jgi:malic enzyme